MLFFKQYFFKYFTSVVYYKPLGCNLSLESYSTHYVLCSKDLYQVQETLKKLCEFSTVWADQADLGSTETAEQKLKYATFEGGFFSFSGSKKTLIFF